MTLPVSIRSTSRLTRVVILAVAPALLGSALVGCGDPAKNTYKAEAKEAQPEKQASETQVTIELTGENTTVSWTGSHVADNDGHDGGFHGITGTLGLDGEPAVLSSLEATIDIASIWTDNDNDAGEGALKNHLLNEDFFNVSEHDESSFVATDLRTVTDDDDTAPMDEATHMVTGNFTMMGQTHSITFPALVSLTDERVAIDSTFSIDRGDWGMGYGIANGAIRDAVIIRLNIDVAR